jgi:ribonuclease HI
MAVLKAIEFNVENSRKLFGVEPEDVALIINCDSKYVTDNFKNNLPLWKSNGYQRTNKRPVINSDLWMNIEGLVARLRSISFKWVKGHSRDKWNKFVDRLVRDAIGGLNCPAD